MLQIRKSFCVKIIYCDFYCCHKSQSLNINIGWHCVSGLKTILVRSCVFARLQTVDTQVKGEIRPNHF